MGVWLAMSSLAVGLNALNVAPASAQSDGIQWSEPVNLSNSPTGSVHPAIVADAYGHVHVFWGEDMNGAPMETDEILESAANTIMYRRWDGASWSEPVDVLAVAGEDVAEFIAVTVDPSGRIHATWKGQSNIYYSSAPAWEAGNVHAWTKPIAIATDNAASMRESSIAASPSGDIHVIYATRGTTQGTSAEVYHVSLGEGGTIRSAPRMISAPLTPLERGYANLRLVSDAAGRLHAVWQSFQRQGFGQGVYYSRSLDGGSSWSAPNLLRYREGRDVFVEWPYLTVGANSDLHLVYASGSSVGRAYRISRDGGETWSEPGSIVQELEGINGYVMPVLDGADQVHLIANMRTREGQVVGIYYARSTDDGFSTSTPIAVEAPYAPSAHYTAAAVRLGDEIHVVWNSIAGSEIWHTRGKVQGVMASPALTIPTPVPKASLALLPTATAVEAAATSAPIPVAAHLPGVQRATASTMQSLLISLLPAVLLVLGTILWARTRLRR